MKFIVDAMAGRLAKWLRILGFDTVYSRGGGPQELLERARREKRTVLTRNETLQRDNPSGVVLLHSGILAEQIRQVVEQLDLKERIRSFTRCSECNTPLLPKSKEEARGHVPFFVHQTQERFGYCPRCHRFYWEGTHHREMLKRLARLGY